MSVIYASNDEMQRRDLWKELNDAYTCMTSEPWIVLGDFNVIEHMHERSDHFDEMPIHSSTKNFQDCLYSIGLTDLHSQGAFYTWTNKRTDGFLAKKLDRFLINDHEMQHFLNFKQNSLLKTAMIIVQVGLYLLSNPNTKQGYFDISHSYHSIRTLYFCYAGHLDMLVLPGDSNVHILCKTEISQACFENIVKLTMEIFIRELLRQGMTSYLYNPYCSPLQITTSFWLSKDNLSCCLG